jgi:hypothetical protein
MSDKIEVADGPSFPATAKGNCEMMAYFHSSHGGNTVSVEAFLLEYGEEFTANARPEWVEQMTPKMCFMNAFILVDEQVGGLLGEDVPDLTYCEGYVLSSGLPIPIHHAWCVTDDGTLVDPTLQDRTTEETVTYFGVRVADFEGLNEVLEETGTYSVLFKRHGHALIERIHSDRKASP